IVGDGARSLQGAVYSLEEIGGEISNLTISNAERLCQYPLTIWHLGQCLVEPSEQGGGLAPRLGKNTVDVLSKDHRHKLKDAAIRLCRNLLGGCRNSWGRSRDFFENLAGDSWGRPGNLGRTPLCHT